MTPEFVPVNVLAVEPGSPPARKRMLAKGDVPIVPLLSRTMAPENAGCGPTRTGGRPVVPTAITPRLVAMRAPSVTLIVTLGGVAALIAACACTSFVVPVQVTVESLVAHCASAGEAPSAATTAAEKDTLPSSSDFDVRMKFSPIVCLFVDG